MPIPLIFSEPESKYVQAAKRGDIAAVVNFTKYESSREHARALLAACTTGQTAVVEFIMRHELVKLNDSDVTTLLYPALRLRKIELILLLKSKQIFTQYLADLSPGDHTINLLEDMVVYNERAQALTILRALWPEAAANKAKFPSGILASAVLQPILDLLEVENAMYKYRKNYLPKDVTNLIFNFLCRMQPIRLEHFAAPKKDITLPSVLQKKKSCERKSVSFS